MLFLLIACQNNKQSEEIWAVDQIETISIGSSLGEVSEQQLSVALDLGQVLGAHFWNPDIEAEEAEIDYPEYDFTRPLLHTLAKELAPAVLRIGGTESDRIYYAMDGEIPEPLPEGYTSVLDVSSNNEKLRVYGHCHPEQGRTLVAINLSEDASLGIEQAGEVYTLSGEALTAERISLNGAELSLQDGLLPELVGEIAEKWTLPPHSISFLHQAGETCP